MVIAGQVHEYSSLRPRMHEYCSADQVCSMHPFTLAAWFLFECLSLLTYGNSQVSSLVATALYAAFYAFLRCSLLWWYEDNKVSPRRAHSDLFQFPLVCQSASNVVVLGSPDSLHWGGIHCPLQNSQCDLASEVCLRRQAYMRICISGVEGKSKQLTVEQPKLAALLRGRCCLYSSRSKSHLAPLYWLTICLPSPRVQCWPSFVWCASWCRHCGEPCPTICSGPVYAFCACKCP